jgi:hypothetical protein
MADLSDNRAIFFITGMKSMKEEYPLNSRKPSSSGLLAEVWMTILPFALFPICP